MSITFPNTQRPAAQVWLQAATGSELIVGPSDVVRGNKSGSVPFGLGPDVCEAVANNLVGSPFFSSLNVNPKAIGGRALCIHWTKDRGTTLRRFRELQLSLFKQLIGKTSLVENYFPRVQIARNGDSGGTAIHHDDYVLLSLAYSFPKTPNVRFGKLSLFYDETEDLVRPKCIVKHNLPIQESKPYNDSSMAEYTPRYQGAGKYNIIIFRDDVVYHQAGANTTTDPYSSAPPRDLDIISESAFPIMIDQAIKLFLEGKDITRM